MITPLEVAFAEYFALVRILEYFIYSRYGVAFSNDSFIVPPHVHAQTYLTGTAQGEGLGRLYPPPPPHPVLINILHLSTFQNALLMKYAFSF